MPGRAPGTNGTRVTLLGEVEEEEAAAAQAAVLTIVPVFCAMGLLGILVCNLLKKRGYHCTASKEPQPGGTGEPWLCHDSYGDPTPCSAHSHGFLSSLSQGILLVLGVLYPPSLSFPSLSQLLLPGPSSIYQLEDANEDTIGVLVRLITEKKGQGVPGKGRRG